MKIRHCHLFGGESCKVKLIVSLNGNPSFKKAILYISYNYLQLGNAQWICFHSGFYTFPFPFWWTSDNANIVQNDSKQLCTVHTAQLHSIDLANPPCKDNKQSNCNILLLVEIPQTVLSSQCPDLIFTIKTQFY